MITRRATASPERVLCPAPHQYGPADPAAWQTWAERMAEHHEQRTCPDCRLPVIWALRTPPLPPPEQTGLFGDGPEAST